jgi:hypothetical protein
MPQQGWVSHWHWGLGSCQEVAQKLPSRMHAQPASRRKGRAEHRSVVFRHAILRFGIHVAKICAVHCLRACTRSRDGGCIIDGQTAKELPIWLSDVRKLRRSCADAHARAAGFALAVVASSTR